MSYRFNVELVEVEDQDVGSYENPNQLVPGRETIVALINGVCDDKDTAAQIVEQVAFALRVN